MNPDAPDSPMAILKTSLWLLQEHAATQTSLRNSRCARPIREEVREALARIELNAAGT